MGESNLAKMKIWGSSSTCPADLGTAWQCGSCEVMLSHPASNRIFLSITWRPGITAACLATQVGPLFSISSQHSSLLAEDTTASKPQRKHSYAKRIFARSWLKGNEETPRQRKQWSLVIWTCYV